MQIKGAKPEIPNNQGRKALHPYYLNYKEKDYAYWSSQGSLPPPW